MIGALEDASLAHTRQSQRLLAVKMLRTLREDEACTAVGRCATVDTAFWNRYVQSAERVHDLCKDVHIGDDVMVHLQSEIPVEGARQETGPKVGAPISIGGVELLIVGLQVFLDFGNVHPQGARKLQHRYALLLKIHAHGAHHIGQPVAALARTHIGPDPQNGHRRQVIASQEWGGGSLRLEC